MRRALAAAATLVAVGACRGDEQRPAPSTSPPPAPVADAAVAVPDATIGPILDLVRCMPAPVMPGESLSKPAQVTLGATKIAEGPGKAGPIADLLRKRQNRLRYCYEQNLGRKPALEGSSLMTLILEPNGYVHEAYLEQSIDDELSLCIKHIVSELQFPAVADKTVAKVPLTFTWHGTPNDADGTPAAWTPFAAASTLVSTEDAIQAAVAAQKAMPTAQLATCLTDQTGALRAVMQVAADGSVHGARVGGFGDAKAEACIAQKLEGVQVGTVPAASEIACDFVRGDARPWRIAGAGGYVIIDATGERVGSIVPTPKTTGLIIISPSTSASILALAMKLAAGFSEHAWLVGMRMPDGGIEYVAAERKAKVIADPAAPLILDTREPLRVCSGLLDMTHTAPASGVDALLAEAAHACTHKPCPTQLTIGLGGKRTGAELASYVEAARAAGFERIRFGTGSCAP